MAVRLAPKTAPRIEGKAGKRSPSRHGSNGQLSQVAPRVGKERLSGERPKTYRSAGNSQEGLHRPLVPARVVPWNRELDKTYADALEKWKHPAYPTNDD